jgi:FlaA1/EpsC-like NDP-sugar epimerase
MVESDRTGRRQISSRILRYHGALSCLGHVVLFAVAFFCAFGLYYNFSRFERWFEPFYITLGPLVVLIKTIVFARMKLFRGTWRYVGMRDLWAMTMATHVSTFLFVVCYFTLAQLRPDFFNSRPQFPQSVFLLDWGATIGVLSAARVVVRLYYEEIRQVASKGQRICLILGAGDTGEALLREILRMRQERHQVVGFLDDDPAKQGTHIHGVPVLGKIAETKAMCETHQVEELLLAMPGASQKTLRRIVEQCEGMNVLFRTIPAMEAVIAGKVTVSQIRDVSIKDVLGREQVKLDQAQISEFIHDEVVLVTGAGGSIGSELCRQISRYKPRKMVLVEQAENNLFEIDRDLQREFPDVPRATYVADICDAPRVDHILITEKPALLFHAAAHKHVPMMEINVGEAIKNNVLGTKTIASAAKKHKVRRFVMISTDKAVNPTSVMGCTKRVAEMYIQQLRQDGITQFMTVRFGNVLGSSGSVVPIFAAQIAAGGPVTVTDPQMTRYFMTIPEASQLVLQAGVMGKDGDIFVLDMGEPVKIVDLAREMITLSGLRPGEDIEIQFTGIRPGEKLYEELSVTGENIGPTTHEKIYVWRNKKEDWDPFCRAMDELIAHADDLDPDQLRSRLTDIVPEGSLGSTSTPVCRTQAALAEIPSDQPSSSHRPNHPTLPYGESPAV